MVGQQRLVVRRTRLVGDQAELFPDWRHFAFLTNRVEALELVEREHRQHAVVELAIRDLKDQGMAPFPSGKFNANAAWDRDRLPRAQPAALEQPDWAPRPDPPRRTHPAPPAAAAAPAD